MDGRGIDELLAPLPGWRREVWDVRVERWWPDLADAVAGLHFADPTGVTERVGAVAASVFAERPADLARLDHVRTLQPDWLQTPGMVGYATYADRFAGDLQGVADHVDYLRELGVTYLHLLPLLATRPGDDDGGYAVGDHTRVRSDLGTMDDLRHLAGRLRVSGISLVLDLVLNHVAREHPWAMAARAGDPRFRAFFHLFPDRGTPDVYEATLPEVFPDQAPGNFTWDPEAGAWVWTTFNAFQWDLNWSNPDVLVAMAGIVGDLANVGAEVLRLDAIPFVWKRMGTASQNQPEVHAVAAALRAFLRLAAPAVALKAEAIVGPDELVRYLGTGRWNGRGCDLAYHNSLMVQIWSMLASRDVRLAAAALRRLPPAPAGTTWITYLRCHDDIGWAIDDADAAAAGLDGPAHRSFLSDYYSGAFPGSPARGLVFQANPRTGDRRISGTTASLAGLAAVAGDPAAEATVTSRILLAHAVVLGWGGLPVLWMGDELGLPDNPDWAAEPGHGGDNRWSHRPRMDWDLGGRRHDPGTVQGRLHAGLRHLIATRARLPQLHGAGTTTVLEVTDPGVLTLRRDHPLGPLVLVFNVTETGRAAPVAGGIGDAIDVLTGDRLDASLPVELGPYQARWLLGADVAPTVGWA